MKRNDTQGEKPHSLTHNNFMNNDFRNGNQNQMLRRQTVQVMAWIGIEGILIERVNSQRTDRPGTKLYIAHSPKIITIKMKLFRIETDDDNGQDNEIMILVKWTTNTSVLLTSYFVFYIFYGAIDESNLHECGFI